MDCNVGYDFKKEKSTIPRMKKVKLEQLFKAHILSKNKGDISLLKVDELPDMDFFTYSFPCTDISVAGKQEGLEKGSGTRSSLLWECEKVITGKRPEYLMMENVKNLVGKNHKEDFDIWLGILDGLGYNNYWKVINAKDCGVPQNRERVFCLSVRKDVDDGHFKFNKPFDSGLRLKDVLEDKVDEKYYISDEIAGRLLENLKNDKTILLDMCQAKREGNPREYLDNCPTLSARDYKEPRLIIERQFNECIKELDIPKEIINDNERQRRVYSIEGISPTVLGRQDSTKILTPNECVLLGKVDYNGHDYIKRVYSAEGVSPTLNTNGGGNREVKTMQDFRIRKITPKECFRLMGLTDDEIHRIQSVGISNSQQYKLAGNSIVVDCMFFLKNLFNY